MPEPALKKYITPAEYLEMEEAAEYKSEYYQGDIQPMTEGTSNHNRIIKNLATKMAAAIESKNCGVFSQNKRIWIAGVEAFTYPDIVVICGQPNFYQNRRDTLVNPLLLVEVQSESFRNDDSGTKFVFYRAIPTLREYLVIAQKHIHVEQYSLSDTGKWFLKDYDDTDAILRCASTDFQIPLREIYQKVEIETEERRA